jgi:hypothetical protein
MADAGLFIGWGQVVRGREGPAVDSFNEAAQYYGQLQQDGRIESFEICLLEPHGGDLDGFMLLRGSEEQIDAVRRDEEFTRLMIRADLIVENLGVVHALLGEGIARGMEMYQEQIGAFA